MKTRLPFALAISGIIALAMLAGLPLTLGAGQATSDAYSRDELLRSGPVRMFEGQATLRELAFPLGGIGTGTVSLGGRPRQPARLGDLQPSGQGRGLALYVLRPLLPCGKGKSRLSASWKAA